MPTFDIYFRNYFEPYNFCDCKRIIYQRYYINQVCVLSQVQLNILQLIVFSSLAENAIYFQCHYPREISVDQQTTITGGGTDDGTGDGTTVGLAVGTGDFTYAMSINVGELGGNTEVEITPNHNFSGVAPRLVFILDGAALRVLPPIFDPSLNAKFLKTDVARTYRVFLLKQLTPKI